MRYLEEKLGGDSSQERETTVEVIGSFADSVQSDPTVTDWPAWRRIQNKELKDGKSCAGDSGPKAAVRVESVGAMLAIVRDTQVYDEFGNK